MKWEKRVILGEGSFGTVFLGEPTDPTAPPIAIKTSPLATSSSLQLERRVLDLLHGCPEIVTCLGCTVTVENLTAKNPTAIYNLLLEYAAGGSLADLIKRGSGLCECESRRCVRMILRGLSWIHRRGMVHCDLKPGNILVFPGEGGPDDYQLKIADFGLVKQGREGEEERRSPFRGTPIYMSPESVASGEIKSALDIWSLGCIVIKMITGKSVWKKCRNRKEVEVAVLKESPTIPEVISEEGRDFLRRCFERNPKDRWTAEMLLNHPFVAALDEVCQPIRETVEPPKSPWDVFPSGLHQSLLSSDGLPPPGWCSFTPSDQRSNQSMAASDGMPPPGWCSITPSDQSSSQSIAASDGMPLPGWCSFSSPDSLHSSDGMPPPGWCSFSSSSSLHSSFSLPPPGWCSFSSSGSLHQSTSLPPPGWCSFSTMESELSTGKVSDVVVDQRQM